MKRAAALTRSSLRRPDRVSVLNEKFVAANTLIGNVKTALTRTYRAINLAKYAYRYLAEVQFRFDRRNNLRATRLLTTGLDSKSLSPRNITIPDAQLPRRQFDQDRLECESEARRTVS